MSDSEQTSNFSSRSELGPVQRRIQSHITRLIVSPARRRAVAKGREIVRRLSGAPHRVHYFHQASDPYSHLAAQTLSYLCNRYEIELLPHVTVAETGPNQPEPLLLAALARRDCHLVAPHYGLEFPLVGDPPKEDAVRSATRLLVSTITQGSKVFAARAVEIGSALWSGNTSALDSLADPITPATDSATDEALSEGTALRKKLGHYSGAVFYYAGVWYWGVDRLYHLEHRLAELGARRADGAGISHRNTDGETRFARPSIPMQRVERASEIVLEVFPSLRSPYSAISFERIVELAEHTGVQLVVRPVLPMVMRGVPVSMSKGMYIMTDTQREAEAMGMPFGRILDPIGQPVRRGFSLWPWARDSGRGEAYLSAFLRAAFALGVDTGRISGLRWTVESAGLCWADAQQHLDSTDWEDELEANRLAMVGEMGIWGVPSFRLRGPGDAADLCCWGQDRLWLIAREIQERGGAQR